MSPLHRLASYWNRRVLMSLGLVAASVALAIVLPVAAFLERPTVHAAWMWIALSVAGFFLLYLLCKHRLATPEKIAEHLNRTDPRWEESAQLLLKPASELSLLELRQLQRLHAQPLHAEALLPNPFRPALQVALVSILCGTGVMWLGYSLRTEQTRATQAPPLSRTATLLPTVTRLSVELVPPRYTQRERLTSPSLDLRTIEQTTATWTLELSQPARTARLIFNHDDTLYFPAQGLMRQVSTTLSRSGFYFLEVETEHGIERSHYYKIFLERDEPPAITILEPHQRTEVDLLRHSRLTLVARIHDDFAVRESNVQAVLAQGKGENIRFKKLFFPFDAVHREQHTKTLDLLALGLKPGDELYLTVEAQDNREPQPNRTRSETVLITTKDTAEVETDFSMSLPVAAQPDYFRSQRQIIIDTEKLLRERRTLSPAAFQARSEALGVDQKVLRLRYGKFLGEEFESAIGGAAMEEIERSLAPKDSTPHPLLKFIRHVHDENCGHLSKASLAALEKNPNETAVEKLMSQFVHAHDTEEGATFYSDAIKAQLKAALAEMWDAELYLRMHKPEEALPYELKALKLLKALQQNLRLYVQRMGFEPPTLKPDEKRLSGKLDKVVSRTVSQTLTVQDEFAAVRKALAVISNLRAGQELVSGTALQHLTQGGTALARAAESDPLRYLDALQALRQFLDAAEQHGRAPLVYLEPVERALWSLLPQPESRPERHHLHMPTLAKSYFQHFSYAR